MGSATGRTFVSGFNIVTTWYRLLFVRNSGPAGLDVDRFLTFLSLGRGDDTVGNPHRAQISRFELFELSN